jgi:phosphohistidine swiveling domain-containing protein
MMELTSEATQLKPFAFGHNDENAKGAVGKKAESLQVLTIAGFPVPEATFVTFEAHTDFLQTNAHLVSSLRGEETAMEIIDGAIFSSALKSILVEFIMRFPNDRFAVRSSGALEDLNDTSFAGMYSTYLNLKNIEEVERAMKYCWSSVYNERVIDYCEQNSIPREKLQMGVVLQRMIDTDVAGVAFSVNPITGKDKEVLIEACYGLGEGLVAGIVTPDQYLVDWHAEEMLEKTIGEKNFKVEGTNEWPFTATVTVDPEAAKTSTLSDGDLSRLTEMVVDIQAHYGQPMDIEWGIKNGDLYIFQARPITTISYSAYKEEWTTADFKDGGVSSTVCTPFMWSAYKMVWDYSMPEYLMSIAFLKKNEGITWGDMFYGRPYWNLTAVKKTVERLPGYCEREFDEDLGIEVTYEGNGIKTGFNLKTILHGVKVLGKLSKSFKKALAGPEQFKTAQEEKLIALEAFELDKLDDKACFAWYKSFMEKEYFDNEVGYFTFIFDNSNYNTLFKDYYRKLKVDSNYLNLISGLQKVSHLKPIQDLWNLAGKIRKDASALAFWNAKSIDEIAAALKAGDSDNQLPAFAEYIKQYRYHSTRELDITIARYDEDPSFVIGNLKDFLVSRDELSPYEKNDKQFAVYQKEIENISQSLSPRKGKKAVGKIEELRKFLWWREEYRDLSTQFYYYVRKFTLEVGARWKKSGIIEDVNDIFFLDLAQITACNSGSISKEDAQQIVRRNKLYYNAFRNYNNAPEIGNRFKSKASSGKKGNKSGLAGVPCSSGTVTGTARVIQDIFDSGRIEEGDILVTKFTDPGWTPKFKLISGVVTENGGVLSHAAVISREYGIPAILAVKDAMSYIKDGQQITIDGDTGEIEIHQ